VWEAIEVRLPRSDVRTAVDTVNSMLPPPEALPEPDWRAELPKKTHAVVGLCRMLTSTIEFGANAEGAPVLAAMKALGEQLAADSVRRFGPRVRPVVSAVGASGSSFVQYLILARARRRSGVVVGKPKNSRYAGICSNSMSVPTWISQPRSYAAARNGVMACFMTTSPTNVPGSSRDMSIGNGSPSFMPMGVALTTISQPAGSLEPVITSKSG